MLIKNGSTPRIVFVMVDATDDETAETGLSPAVEISKNGGSFATTTNSAVEIGNGWYYVDLTATETDTDGALIVRATATGADEWRDYHQVYSSLSTTSERTSIADAVLGRDFSSVTGAAARSVLNALRALRNRVSVASGTMTVYQEDDTTVAWSGAVTTDTSADLITEIDPA